MKIAVQKNHLGVKLFIEGLLKNDVNMRKIGPLVDGDCYNLLA